MVFHSAMNCPLLQRSPWYCTLFLTAFLSAILNWRTATGEVLGTSLCCWSNNRRARLPRRKPIWRGCLEDFCRLLFFSFYFMVSFILSLPPLEMGFTRWLYSRSLLEWLGFVLKTCLWIRVFLEQDQECSSKVLKIQDLSSKMWKI